MRVGGGDTGLEERRTRGAETFGEAEASYGAIAAGCENAVVNWEHGGDAQGGQGAAASGSEKFLAKVRARNALPRRSVEGRVGDQISRLIPGDDEWSGFVMDRGD